ncbi:molybdopterin-guanine dinucleotide biosynthesis protein B [Neobacillus sp. PS3-34]|uniref:molybdopterin-guanine dinucleotide biosynthesis protein B n=1 Tax=Neobacillus sp. PS3-34 TaxID=3070678 RepID=UPI0027DEDCB0|nr:molybdopterin-guanine dinucleotide biosynthesis protein B [Neobacillus sp. PS3-34]WML49582.1 molybdopterin-guanine dinucleotide biosynthesis protein B [Neobacillus sp. PS3-34]
MVRQHILQIAGYQNSGKTTFITGLIEELQQKGLKVVTIKHHGHGGKPAAAEGKDTSRHLKAGAAAALVEGDGRLILQAESQNWSLEEKIQLISFFRPDIILVEGHKYEAFPKIVIIREEQDLHLLDDLQNIQAVLFWNEKLIRNIDKHRAYSCLLFHDENVIKEIIIHITDIKS